MGNIKLFLRANDRIFINGAVLRTDRKVSLELLNNATFLLENHVLQKEDADTPLKQLYFIVQMLLIDPVNTDSNRALIRNMINDILHTETAQEIAFGIKEADVEISSGKILSGLKLIRKLYPLETEQSANSNRANNPLPKTSINAKYNENSTL